MEATQKAITAAATVQASQQCGPILERVDKFELQLGDCTQQVYQLAALVRVIHEHIGGDETQVGRAELLAGLACQRLDEFAEIMCGIEVSFRQIKQGGLHD